MNIPKPAIWAGLAALVGVYIFTRTTGDPPVEAEHDESSHTHADGTKHSGSEHSADEGSASKTAPASNAALTDPSGGKLQAIDTVKGTGATAADGKSLTMNYRGTLSNGTQFDSSYDRGEPFTFTLGAGSVIKGWDQGIKGMKVGGKRKLVIPGSLAYGPAGSPPAIPPNATLLFDVELLAVK